MWLSAHGVQGGPGGSSMFGLLKLHGPILSGTNEASLGQQMGGQPDSPKDLQMRSMV